MREKGDSPAAAADLDLEMGGELGESNGGGATDSAGTSQNQNRRILNLIRRNSQVSVWLGNLSFCNRAHH